MAKEYTTKSIAGPGLDHHFGNIVVPTQILIRSGRQTPEIAKYSQKRLIEGLDYLIPLTEDSGLKARLEDLKQTAEQGDFSDLKVLKFLTEKYQNIQKEYT